MINLPIFRAKKLDSDEYVIGFYEGWEEKHFIVTSPKEFFKIDPATLSIHFPDMLDNQGNKIFASLQEDGKGGDIVDTTIGLRQNFVTICLSSGVCVFTSDTSAIKNTPCKFILDYKHRGIKVVGIQKEPNERFRNK